MTARAPAAAPAVGRQAPSLADFEAGRLDAAAFDHPAHVRVAWELLGAAPLPEAIARYSAALRRLTAALGAPGKYHETVTWFFVLLIAERRAASGGVGWEAFAAANPDLLGSAGAVLERYYSPARLALPESRASFLLPDRAPAQGAGTTR